MRCANILVKIYKINMKIANTNTQHQEVAKLQSQWTLIPRWEEYKMVYPTWKTAWWLLRKLSIFMLSDSAVLFLGIYLSKLKNVCSHTEKCTLIFIAVLLTITPIWKPPRCPSTNEWINTLGSHVMKYRLAVKGGEQSITQITWPHLKCSLLSERSIGSVSMTFWQRWK